MCVVLVVDNDGLVAGNVSAALAGDGGLPAVIERRTGSSALTFLREGSCVDVAVIDDRLEEMGWMQFLAHVRTFAPGLPVILLSGRQSVEDYVKAVSAGVFEVVARPVSPRVLRQLVNDALEEGSSFRHLRSGPHRAPKGGRSALAECPEGGLREG